MGGYAQGMDKSEAEAIVAVEARRLRALSYAELRDTLLDQTLDSEVVGRSGERYHVQVQAFVDDDESGDLRVLASIDDGGLRTLWPVTDTFTISTSGRISEHSPAG